MSTRWTSQVSKTGTIQGRAYRQLPRLQAIGPVRNSIGVLFVTYERTGRMPPPLLIGESGSPNSGIVEETGVEFAGNVPGGVRLRMTRP